MDLPDCIVENFLVFTSPLLSWELVCVRGGLSETVRLPEFELELLVDLPFTDCGLFVLPLFELLARNSVLLRADLLYRSSPFVLRSGREYVVL